MRVLTDNDLNLPEKVEKNIIEEAKQTLLQDFEEIKKSEPDLEQKIFSVKGLMTDLLSYRTAQKPRIGGSRDSSRSGSRVMKRKNLKSSFKRVRFAIEESIFPRSGRRILHRRQANSSPRSV